MKRAVGVVAALLVVAVTGAFFVELEVPEAGAAALREASRRSGLAIDAERYRFSLRAGLTLERVSLRRSLPGVRYRCDAESLSFGYRWPRLLIGELALDSVHLEAPRLAVETGFAPAERNASDDLDRERRSERGDDPPPREDEDGGRVSLAVGSFSLRNASLAIDGAAVVRALDLRLERPRLASGALTILHALSGEGELVAEEVALSGTSFLGARARFSAEGGRFELTEASWSVGDATMEGGLTLDLNSIPPRYRVQGEARHRSLQGVLRVDASGYGVDLARLSGTGELELAAGRFDDAPVFRALELAGSEHERIVAAIRIDDGVLTLDGDALSGSVRIDGAVDLTLLGRRVGGSWSEPVAR